MVMHNKIAVVLPCYNSREQVLGVISRIGREPFLIVVVDDACPMGTGVYVQQHCRDTRLVVVYNDTNLGVGGAVIHGYRVALARGADIVVKIDSDGQMDPAILSRVAHPIIVGLADYAKGNRFFNVHDVKSMPAIRVIGNAALSFVTKLSSGYWSIFDPTNGYTAIHRLALEMLPLDKLDKGFFFESDMLFRLYTSGAVVIDVPMRAHYAGERSSLKISRVFFPFLLKNMRNFLKRVFYRYFLRDVNLGSLELVFGMVSFCFGIIYGVAKWVAAVAVGAPATAGTVMLAALPTLAGLQLILGFFAFDLMAIPKVPLQTILGREQRNSAEKSKRTLDSNQVGGTN
jgi:dolichol-phosphate mannosyltransferase